ncbi:MAG: apolipoprotein N-acyltransferase [Pseudomonadota bacterium]
MAVADTLSRPWSQRGAAFGAGLLLALGAAPFSVVWGVFLAIPLMIYLMRDAAGPRAGFALGWWCGTAFFGATLYWIVEPFFVDAPRHGWMAPFALFFVAVGFGLFWGVAGALATRFSGAGRGLAFVLWLTMAEFLRAHVATGFPWGQISYGWVDTPVFQSLAFAGPHGLTLLTRLAAALPMVLRPAWGLGFAAVILAVGWGAGTWRLGTPVVETATVLRLIQPNAPQDEKWLPEMVPVFFDRALAQTTAAPGPLGPADAVIWPETSVPFLWAESAVGRARMETAAGGRHLIAGHRQFKGPGLYNSLIHLNRSGAVGAEYDKHHLVPFGEYVPLASFAARIGIYGLAAEEGMGFAAGPGPQMLEVDDLPAYIPLICYEAIFPGLAQIDGTRAGWLLHITNDAWFGRFAGPYQHLVQAQARAIEQGLPLARAANTGVSAMIDPLGRVTAALALNTQGHLDVALPASLAPPPYTRFGEGPWLALWLGMMVGLVGRRFRTERRRKMR